MVLAALTWAHIHFCFCRHFLWRLGERTYKWEDCSTGIWYWMVLILEMRELQVPGGVFQKVRTKFIDGLWNTEWGGHEPSKSRRRLAEALGSGNDRANAGPASIQHHSVTERKIWRWEFYPTEIRSFSSSIPTEKRYPESPLKVNKLANPTSFLQPSYLSSLSPSSCSMPGIPHSFFWPFASTQPTLETVQYSLFIYSLLPFLPFDSCCLQGLLTVPAPECHRNQW